MEQEKVIKLKDGAYILEIMKDRKRVAVVGTNTIGHKWYSICQNSYLNDGPKIVADMEYDWKKITAVKEIFLQEQINSDEGITETTVNLANRQRCKNCAGVGFQSSRISSGEIGFKITRCDQCNGAGES